MAFDPLQEARYCVGETEFYAFDMGDGVIERYTSSRRDVPSAFGFYWKALPIARQGVDLDQNTDGAKTKLVLPVQPRFVEIVAEAGLDVIRVAIIRGFGRNYAADYRNPWFLGYLTDINVGINVVEGNLVSVEGLLDAAIPRILVQPGCNWQLYGPGCALNIAAFQETRTVTSVGGPGNRLLTISGATLTTDFYTFGYIKKADAGTLWKEIVQQAGDQFVIHVPMLNVKVGDQVHIARGCDKFVTTCVLFGNKSRFNGMPLTPASNPVVDGF